jgi:hypothetical protein
MSASESLEKFVTSRGIIPQSVALGKFIADFVPKCISCEKCGRC